MQRIVEQSEQRIAALMTRSRQGYKYSELAPPHEILEQARTRPLSTLSELSRGDNIMSNTDARIPIALARGDGIGPEIVDATVRILEAADAPLDYREVQIGEEVYKQGITSGITDEAWDALRETGVILKGPITTPQGSGYKSLNVTIRKSLSLFANVRQCKAYNPYVKSLHPNMNVVIIRENEEGLYASIEHRQTPEVYQCLKLITRPGCERIIRYAFQYAEAYGREKVTAMSKDNIMKMTDGIFHEVFNEVAEEYPDIESDHRIIDIGAAHVAALPETLDVVVTQNLYGDILSDIAAQVAGSVGLAGSANIGETAAMFEAVHGSAPDIAGQGIANPSGVLIGATKMLVHVGLAEHAALIKNAWLKTLEDGIHTVDIFSEDVSKKRVGTADFASAVIDRLGETPSTLKPVAYRDAHIDFSFPATDRPEKTLEGVDVFIDWADGDRDPDRLGHALEEAVSQSPLKLKMITNRGCKVYPGGLPETFWTDHWRCRFVPRKKDDGVDFDEVLELQRVLNRARFDIIKTENLYNFAGERGYSLGQGE
jgi:isocitrate dehydrogenase